MIAKDIYKKETGNDISFDNLNAYYIWLKEIVEQRYEPSILKRIKLMFTQDRYYFEEEPELSAYEYMRKNWQ